MGKTDYINQINELMEETNDLALLDLIAVLLVKSRKDKEKELQHIHRQIAETL